MECDRSPQDRQGFAAGADQPLIGVLVEEDGRQFVRYSTSTSPPPARSEETLQAALATVGAWQDLDWDDFSSALDRIRHESPPTPPIEV